MCRLQEWCRAEESDVSRQGRSWCDDDTSGVREREEGTEERSEEKDSKQNYSQVGTATIKASTTLGTYAIEGTTWSGSQEGTSTDAELAVRASKATTEASAS